MHSLRKITERNAFRALRHRNYALFFSGQLLSLAGTWMQSVAQSWLVYRLTGSAALLGAVAFATQFPVLVLAPVGGVVADTTNRRRILLATQTTAMLLAFVLAALTLTDRIRVAHLFIVGVMLGIVNAFDIPGRQSFVIEMVGRDDLMNAIALNSAMVNASRILGPAAAGVLVAAVGEGWCFALNGFSFLAVLIGLLAMTLPATVVRRLDGSAFANIAEGFRFASRNPPVRAVLLLLGVVSLLGMPYAVLMPIFAEEIFHSGSRGLGVLMGASGVGSLTGALLLANRKGIRGLGRWIAIASMGFGGFLILFAMAPSLWLGILLLAPVGLTMIVQMAASNTLLQAMAPDALRGRIMALYSMMFMGMAPFGALLAGLLGQHIGAPATVAAGGTICVAAGLAFSRRLPILRDEARALILANQMIAGEPAGEVMYPTAHPSEAGRAGTKTV
jgi:MFS family permease